MEASVILLLYTCRNRFDTPIDRVFPIIHRLSIRRNESGLIKPATLPVLVSIRRKMAGGHSKESIGYLIVDRFWFIRNQVSNHRRGKRKEKRDRTLDGKDYFALRYCVPIIGRTPRKVAYIVAFSRCEQRNKIRSFLSSKKTWHERIDSSNYAMCLEKSCCHRAFPIYIYIYISMKRCVVGENCDVFLFFVIYQLDANLDTICTTVVLNGFDLSLHFTVKAL